MLGPYALKALEYYADQVRKDSPDLYFYYRFYEFNFQICHIPDHAELVRKAIIRILKSDPYAYGSTIPLEMEVLTESDLEEIAPAITFGGDENAARFLRGKLWTDAAVGQEDKGKFADRALKELEAIPPDLRDHEFWYSLTECYRAVDYERYKASVPKLLESGEPAWRAFDLIHALREAAIHRDWSNYDSWRKEWDALPVNAHFCDCYFNGLYNYDGLRALETGNTDLIPDLLRKAMEVRGCAHLNSGGANLRLVEALIPLGLFPKECAAYLDASEQFGKNPKTEELRARLASIPPKAST